MWLDYGCLFNTVHNDVVYINICRVASHVLSLTGIDLFDPCNFEQNGGMEVWKMLRNIIIRIKFLPTKSSILFSFPVP